MAIVLLFAGLTLPRATIWGGEHVEMDVTDGGARLEFDCAHGTIDEPLRPNRTGVFQAKGTFTPERSGPSRDGGPSPAKAVYSGTIKDATMTLRVILDGQSDDGNTYALVRDRPGNVRKCR